MARNVYYSIYRFNSLNSKGRSSTVSCFWVDQSCKRKFKISCWSPTPWADSPHHQGREVHSPSLRQHRVGGPTAWCRLTRRQSSSAWRKSEKQTNKQTNKQDYSKHNIKHTAKRNLKVWLLKWKLLMSTLQWYCLCCYWREFIFLQTKPKGVTTQMKALDEYIAMVLFVLLLKRVHFLANET